jgi:hypothetical protein
MNIHEFILLISVVVLFCLLFVWPQKPEQIVAEETVKPQPTAVANSPLAWLIERVEYNDGTVCYEVYNRGVGCYDRELYERFFERLEKQLITCETDQEALDELGYIQKRYKDSLVKSRVVLGG